MYKDKNNICSCIFNIIASLIVAAGIAAVFFAGLVTSILTLVIITLILGTLTLIGLILKLLCGKKHNCECLENSILPGASIGAIITSIFALTITTLTASVPTAILIGAVAFFLVSLIIGIVDFLICTFCGNKYCKDC